MEHNSSAIKKKPSKKYSFSNYDYVIEESKAKSLAIR